MRKKQTGSAVTSARRAFIHARHLTYTPPPEGLGAVACSRLRKTVLFPDARTLATGRVSDMPP